MIVKKIFYIFIFFPSFHIFSFIEDVEELDASKEDSQEKFYENNKKEFNVKGHLSISSGVINTITLSPLWSILGYLWSDHAMSEGSIVYEVFSSICIFRRIFEEEEYYGGFVSKKKEDIKHVFKGIPYSFFCWLFSCSLRYDYFFNKTIGIGAKFDLFGDIIKQHNPSRKEDEKEDLLQNPQKKLLGIEKVDHECSYYFNLFQVQIYINICYNKQGTNNIFLKKYIGGSLGLTLGLGIEDFIFERKNFYPIFSFQITPVVIFKPNGFFFSFTCFNLFLNRWPYLKYFFKNKKLPHQFSETNKCTFVLEYIFLNCFLLSLKFNFGYSWTLGDKKVKVEEEL